MMPKQPAGTPIHSLVTASALVLASMLQRLEQRRVLSLMPSCWQPTTRSPAALRW